MKLKRIELRYDEPELGGALDELIVQKPDYVHFGRMSDQSIWCGIKVGKKFVRVNVASKNGKAHINYVAEIE